MTQHTAGAEHQTQPGQSSHPYSQCTARGCSRIGAMRHFQAVRVRMGDNVIAGHITWAEFDWQEQLVNATIDRIIHKR